jgi:hypothetical protein
LAEQQNIQTTNVGRGGKVAVPQMPMMPSCLVFAMVRQLEPYRAGNRKRPAIRQRMLPAAIGVCEKSHLRLTNTGAAQPP